MIKAGQIYRHFKTGKTYKVIALAKDSETLELMAVYEAQYDNPESKIWARPLSMFEQEVDWQGQRVKRFSLVE